MILAVDVGGWSIRFGYVAREDPTSTRIEECRTSLPLTPHSLERLLLSRTKDGLIHQVVLGLPGMVRCGVSQDAPPLSRLAYGAEVIREVALTWKNIDLESTLGAALGLQVRVLNDADLQALGVDRRKGLTLVLVLGTGVGTSLLSDGVLLPHLELSHFPVMRNVSLSDYLSNAERLRIGNVEWIERIRGWLPHLWEMTRFDHLVIGGGPSVLIDPATVWAGSIDKLPHNAFIRGAIHLLD